MNKLKKIARYFQPLVMVFFLASFPLGVYADDDLDGNDIGNNDYGYGWQGGDDVEFTYEHELSPDEEDADDDSGGGDTLDISDMNDWTSEDWADFFASHQEDPDGWDGTSATYGQTANDWHEGDRDPDAEDYDYEHSTTVTDADGNIVSITIEDVLQEDGTVSFTYTGPGCEDPDFKAEVEARVEEFFADQETRHTEAALYEAISNLMAAKAELEAAKRAGEDADRIAALEARVSEAASALQELCDNYGYTYSVTGQGNYGTILDREGRAVMRVGDPVIFATGDFVIDDIDLCQYGKKAAFEISRHYSSERAATKNLSFGIFGTGWTSNLESRIVRGYSTDFIEAVPKWESYIAELEEHKDTIEAYTEEDSACTTLYQSMLELYAEANGEYSAIKTKAEESRRQIELNKYVQYGPVAEHVSKVGVDTVFFIQDNGGMIVFNKGENGSYSLSPAFSSLQISLSETGDGGYCVSYLAYGAKRYYSKYGLPNYFTFKDGGRIDFSYDSAMKLESVSLDGKKAFSFYWNGDKLASVRENASGKSVVYGYSDGILSSIRSVDGDVKKFSYDSGGMISRQIKADGSYVQFEFTEIDGKKRCTKTTNEEGKSEYFSYDTAGRKTTYTDHDGRVSVYVYDEKGRTVSETLADGSFTNYEYDSKNRLASKTDNFGTVTFSYDSDGNMTEKNYLDGTSEIWTYSNGFLSSYTDRDGFQQQYYYDSQGLMTDIFRSSKLVYHFEYGSDKKLHSTTDCSGNKTVMEYDSNGNVIEKSVYAPGSAKASKTEKWVYDSQNRLTSFTDAVGRKTTYSYDARSIKYEIDGSLLVEETYSNRNLLVERALTDKKTGEKRIISYEYDKNKNCVAEYISGKDSTGREVAETRMYSFDYTDEGLNSGIIEYDVFSENPTDWATSFSYSSDGNISSSKNGYYGSSFYGAKTLNYTKSFDGESQVAKIYDEEGKITTQIFDAEGKLKIEKINDKIITKKEYTPAGRILSFKSGKSGFYEYTYDEMGNLSGKREKNGTLSSFDKTTFLADGRIESYTDRNGKTTFYIYDECKNLIKTITPKGVVESSYDGSGRLIFEKYVGRDGKTIKSERWKYDKEKVVHTVGEKYSKTYCFNAFNEIVSVTDGNGNETVFTYDILGRKVCEKDPYGNETKYSYNARGDVTKVILPNKNYLLYEYDAFSNCVSATDNEGLLWKKSYDADGNVKSYSERPFVCTEYYEYDDFGELISVSKNGVVTQKTYASADGVLGNVTDARGKIDSFVYDGFGRLKTWENGLGKKSEYAYNGDGSVAKIADFSGKTKLYSYSEDGLSFTIEYSSGDYVLYSYDMAGNLIQAKNSSSDLRFTYDEACMLVSQKDVDNGTELFFDYDSAKNLVKITGKNREILYTHGKKGEILSVYEKLTDANVSLSTEVRFVYDAMGNETLRVFDSGESVKSSYDKNGRLTLQLGYDSSLNLVYVDGSVFDDGGKKIYSLNSDFSVTAYSYDENGRLSSVSYPYSENLEKAMKKQVTDAGLFYLESGIDTQTLSLSSKDYETLQSLCSVIIFGSFQISANEMVLVEKFFYDENDNLVKRVNPYNTIQYAYDCENRLVSWGENCFAEYDDDGNMTRKRSVYSDISYEYNSINRVKSVSGKDFLHDERFERKNAYDALGRKILEWKSESGTQKISYIGFSTQIFDIKKIFSADYAVYEGNSASKTRTSAASKNYHGRYVFIGDEKPESENRYETPLSEESPYEISPIYSGDGRIMSYFSTGTSAGNSRSVVMSDKAGTIKGEICPKTMNSTYDYDAFGSPVSEKSVFGFVGKAFDERTGLYNFGFRDYESQNARFTSVDPIHSGRNWYSYCSGNPVGFFDKSGLYQLKTDEQYMQDMGHVLLGASSTEYADQMGCLVTAIAEALTAFANDGSGATYTNSFINSCKECFSGGNIDWAALEDEFGLHHETVFVATGTLSSTVNAINAATKADKADLLMDFLRGGDQSFVALAQNLSDESHILTVLSEIKNSDVATVVIAQVVYDVQANAADKNDGLHFVGISTTVVVIDGVFAVQVTATSRSDLAVSAGSKRGASGWLVRNGKVYVPLSRINRIDTITKPD